jgi:pSer/pThr/pTyr-binding forkhead associated (FHA) protein
MQRDELAAPRGVDLVVHGHGQGAGQSVEISSTRPTINVGRVAGNDLVLPSSMLSRRQMRFVYRDGAVYAEDLGSTCGTYVDGMKIDGPTKLGRGAVVEFGDYNVELVER